MEDGAQVPVLPGGYYWMLRSRSPSYTTQVAFSIILEACAEAGCCDVIAEELAALQYVNPDNFSSDEFSKLNIEDRFVKMHPPACVINEILSRSGMDADKFKKAFEDCWSSLKEQLEPEHPVLREVKPNIKHRYKRRPGVFSRGGEDDTVDAYSAAEAAGDAIQKMIEKPFAEAESKPVWINLNLKRLLFKKITFSAYCELEGCAESTARIRLKKYAEYARKIYKKTIEE